jgi:hypothetical protein
VRYLTVFVLCVLFALPFVAAHVPQSGTGNDTLGTAVVVNDPLKSWVYYDEITTESPVQYYALDMQQGQRLRVMAITPESPPFSPSLIVMGAVGNNAASAPAQVELPDAVTGTIISEGTYSSPGYEPFTPGAYSETASVDLVVEEGGRIYLAVYELAHEGRVALAIGYEERFTPIEIVRVPLDAVAIHRWEGQSYAEIFLPGIAAAALVAACATNALRRRKAPVTLAIACMVAVSSSYAGTAAMMAYQSVRSVTISGWDPLFLVSMLWVIIPLFVAAYGVRHAWMRRQNVGTQDRVILAALGLSGLMLWSGLVVFPLIAVLASVAPGRLLSMAVTG